MAGIVGGVCWIVCSFARGDEIVIKWKEVPEKLNVQSFELVTPWLQSDLIDNYVVEVRKETINNTPKIFVNIFKAYYTSPKGVTHYQYKWHHFFDDYSDEREAKRLAQETFIKFLEMQIDHRRRHIDRIKHEIKEIVHLLEELREE